MVATGTKAIRLNQCVALLSGRRFFCRCLTETLSSRGTAWPRRLPRSFFSCCVPILLFHSNPLSQTLSVISSATNTRLSYIHHGHLLSDRSRFNSSHLPRNVAFRSVFCVSSLFWCLPICVGTLENHIPRTTLTGYFSLVTVVITSIELLVMIVMIERSRKLNCIRPEQVRVYVPGVFTV